MDKPQEFLSYKKVIIFGAPKSGKTSLTKSLEGLPFSEDYEPDEGNSLFILNFIFYFK
jgi:GTPase SAR1 family protein